MDPELNSHLLQRGFEGRKINRLGQVGDKARFVAPPKILVHPRTGQGDRAARPVRTEPVKEIVTAPVRQAEVGHEDVAGTPTDHLDCFGNFPRGLDLVPGPPEQPREYLSGIGVILDQQESERDERGLSAFAPCAAANRFRDLRLRRGDRGEVKGERRTKPRTG